jgi:hypothetical protein
MLQALDKMLLFLPSRKRFAITGVMHLGHREEIKTAPPQKTKRKK